jgi:hypothetical protein
MKTKITFALVALTAILAGCSSSSSDDNSADTTDDAIKSASHPAGFVGTWEAEKDSTLLFYSYSFKSDGTYTAQGGCKPNPSGPSCFAITRASGTWKTQKSGPQLGDPAGAQELVLKDSFDQVDTYFYTMTNDVLSLSETYRGKVSKFDHDVADLKSLRTGAKCEDSDGNSLGNCTGDMECLQSDLADDSPYECLPPI